MYCRLMSVKSSGPKKPRPDVETELKIRLTGAALEHVLAQLAPRAVEGKVAHKYTPRQYYDTPDLKLAAQGVALRVQYAPGKKGLRGGFQQMVKYDLGTATEVEGLQAQREIKCDLDGHLPDLSRIADAATAEKVKDIDSKSLRHIFTAAVERRYLLVDMGKGQVVEVAFDRGIISLADKADVALQVCEIELELKKGGPQAVARLRDEILALAPAARVVADSKAELGMGLYKRDRKII